MSLVHACITADGLSRLSEPSTSIGEAERRDHALDGARLRDERVDDVLDDLVPLRIVGGRSSGRRPSGRNRRCPSSPASWHASPRRLRRCGSPPPAPSPRVVADRRALDQRAVGALVAAVPDRGHADFVVVVAVVGVVGEAVVLLLRIVQDQPELHALAGKLAVGERAEAGQDRGKPAVRRPSPQAPCAPRRPPPSRRPSPQDRRREARSRPSDSRRGGRNSRACRRSRNSRSPGRSPAPGPVPCRSCPQSRNSMA